MRVQYKAIAGFRQYDNDLVYNSRFRAIRVYKLYLHAIYLCCSP